MSADAYEDCPCCFGEETVRVDGVHDYELNSDGTITVLIHGHCRNCNTEFKIKKADNGARSRT